MFNLALIFLGRNHRMVQYETYSSFNKAPRTKLTCKFVNKSIITFIVLNDEIYYFNSEYSAFVISFTDLLL